jgi:hypothetical protein
MIRRVDMEQLVATLYGTITSTYKLTTVCSSVTHSSTQRTHVRHNTEPSNFRRLQCIELTTTFHLICIPYYFT